MDIFYITVLQAAYNSIHRNITYIYLNIYVERLQKQPSIPDTGIVNSTCVHLKAYGLETLEKLLYHSSIVCKAYLLKIPRIVLLH